MKTTILFIGIGVAGFLSAAPQDTPKGLQRTTNESRLQKGASFGDDMKAENLRHQDRQTDLYQRGVTIENDFRNELIRCRGEQSCKQKAIEEVRKQRDQLQIDRNNEDATFEKNRAEIIRNWRDNRGNGPSNGKTPPTRWENGKVMVQLPTGEWLPGMPSLGGWLVWQNGQWVTANQ